VIPIAESVIQAMSDWGKVRVAKFRLDWTFVKSDDDPRDQGS
jgi:hypothetical protein